MSTPFFPCCECSSDDDDDGVRSLGFGAFRAFEGPSSDTSQDKLSIGAYASSEIFSSVVVSENQRSPNSTDDRCAVAEIGSNLSLFSVIASVVPKKPSATRKEPGRMLSQPVSASKEDEHRLHENAKNVIYNVDRQRELPKFDLADATSGLYSYKYIHKVFSSRLLFSAASDYTQTDSCLFRDAHLSPPTMLAAIPAAVLPRSKDRIIHDDSSSLQPMARAMHTPSAMNSDVTCLQSDYEEDVKDSNRIPLLMVKVNGVSRPNGKQPSPQLRPQTVFTHPPVLNPSPSSRRMSYAAHDTDTLFCTTPLPAKLKTVEAAAEALADEMFHTGYDSGATSGKSFLLPLLRKQFINGLNCMLTILNTPRCAALSEDLVATMLSDIFADTMECSEASQVQLSLTAYAVLPDGTGVNLLPTKADETRAIKLQRAANPILCHCYANYDPICLSSFTDAVYAGRSIMHNARNLNIDPLSNPDSILLVTLTLQQYHDSKALSMEGSTLPDLVSLASPTADRSRKSQIKSDVLLSSFNIAYVGDNIRAFDTAMRFPEGPLYLTLQQAYVGYSCTMLCTFVDEISEAERVLEVSHFVSTAFGCRLPHPGSVREYCKQLKTYAEDESNKRELDTIKRIYKAHRQLLENKVKSPCVYVEPDSAASEVGNEKLWKTSVKADAVILVPTRCDSSFDVSVTVTCPGVAEQPNKRSGRTRETPKSISTKTEERDSTQSWRSSYCQSHVSKPQQLKALGLGPTGCGKLPSAAQSFLISSQAIASRRESRSHSFNSLSSQAKTSSTHHASTTERKDHSYAATSERCAEPRIVISSSVTENELLVNMSHNGRVTAPGTRRDSSAVRGRFATTLHPEATVVDTLEQKMCTGSLVNSRKPPKVLKADDDLASLPSTPKNQIQTIVMVAKSNDSSTTSQAYPAYRASSDGTEVLITVPNEVNRFIPLKYSFMVSEALNDTLMANEQSTVIRQLRKSFVEDQLNTYLLSANYSSHPLFRRQAVMDVFYRVMLDITGSTHPEGGHSTLLLSGVLLRGQLMVMDLAKYQRTKRYSVSESKVKIGVSSLVGTVLKEVEYVPITRPTEVSTCLNTMLEGADSRAAGVQDAYVVLTVTRKTLIKKANNTPERHDSERRPSRSSVPPDDVVLSSFTVVCLCNSMDFYEDYVTGRKDRYPVRLLDFAIGGPSRTACLVSFDSASTPASQALHALQQQQHLGNIINIPASIGRLSFHLDACKSTVHRLQTELQSMKSAAPSNDKVRLRIENTMAQCQWWIEEHQVYLQDPSFGGLVLAPLEDDMDAIYSTESLHQQTPKPGLRSPSTLQHESVPGRGKEPRPFSAAHTAVSPKESLLPPGVNCRGSQPFFPACGAPLRRSLLIENVNPPSLFLRLFRSSENSRRGSARAGGSIDVLPCAEGQTPRVMAGPNNSGQSFPYTFDEVLDVGDAEGDHLSMYPSSITRSRLLQKLVNCFLSGHNATLMMQETRSAASAGGVAHILRYIFSRVNENSFDSQKECFFSFTYVEGLVGADLLDEDLQRNLAGISSSTKLKDRVDLGYSPLAGPLIVSSKLQRVTTPEDRLAALQSALAAERAFGKSREHVLVVSVWSQTNIVRENDVSLSSITAIFGRGHPLALKQWERAPHSLGQSLLRYALSGSSFVVNVTAATTEKIKQSDTDIVIQMMDYQAGFLCTVTGVHKRHNSFHDLLEYHRLAYAELQRELEAIRRQDFSAPAEEMRFSEAKIVGELLQLKEMIKDEEAVLQRNAPEGTLPPVYIIDSEW